MTGRKIKAVLVAGLAGLSAASATAILFAIAATEIIVRSVKLAHPGDASAGDVAGWMIVILSPVLVVAGILIGLAPGFIAFRLVHARLLGPKTTIKPAA